MTETALLIAILAIVGVALGSFLNLCIDRLPQGLSIVRPASHCPSCLNRVAAFDLVPVLNYAWLQGRCRYCRTRIPARLPIVELLTGASLAYLYWHFALHMGSPAIVTTSVIIFACFMIVVFFIDLDHKLILNKVSYPGIVLFFILAFFRPDLALADALIGGAAGFAFFFIPFLVYPKGMGMGDAKLGLMMGLMIGFPYIFVAIILAVVAGGLLAIALLLLRIKKRREAIPFGPFLAVAAMAALLWGENIAGWYLGLYPV